MSAAWDSPTADEWDDLMHDPEDFEPAMRWLPVYRYEGIYEVSEYGDVRRVSSGRILRVHVKPDTGRRYYHLSVGGRTESRKEHHLVLEAFVGPGNGLWGLHADDDPANNHISNLRWGTPAENSADRRRNHDGLWSNGRENRTHCAKGHEYTPENTYMCGNGRPGVKVRRCRECRHINYSEHYAAQKQGATR